MGVTEVRYAASSCCLVSENKGVEDERPCEEEIHEGVWPKPAIRWAYLSNMLQDVSIGTHALVNVRR